MRHHKLQLLFSRTKQPRRKMSDFLKGRLLFHEQIFNLDVERFIKYRVLLHTHSCLRHVPVDIIRWKHLSRNANNRLFESRGANEQLRGSICLKKKMFIFIIALDLKKKKQHCYNIREGDIQSVAQLNAFNNKEMCLLHLNPHLNQRGAAGCLYPHTPHCLPGNSCCLAGEGGG